MIATFRIILAGITALGAWFLLNLGLELYMLAPVVGGCVLIAFAFYIARPVFSKTRRKHV